MNQRSEPNLHPLLPATEIAAMPEITRVHPLNARAVRYSRSLGDATGLGRLGVHLVRLRRGDSSTELHVHASAEEFVYVLSGWAEFEYEGQGIHRIEAGDCINQRPMIPHREIACSEDFAVIEIVSPANFKTKVVEPPADRVEAAE